MTFAFLQMSASDLDNASRGAWTRVHGSDIDLSNSSDLHSQLSTEDITCLVAIRSGNVEAFQTLFNKHYTTLARYTRRFVPDIEDTDEIIADVFLSIWNRRDSWNPRISIAAYLFRAVRNRARNISRDAHTATRYLHRAAQESVPGMGEHSIPADEAIDITDRESQLWKTIETMPERPRLLLNLRWRAGLPPAEVASALGISVTAVNTGLSRAIQMLRKLLPNDFR